MTKTEEAIAAGKAAYKKAMDNNKTNKHDVRKYEEAFRVAYRAKMNS